MQASKDPTMTPMMFMVPQYLKEQLRDAAEQVGESMSVVIRRAIRKELTNGEYQIPSKRSDQ